MEAITQLSDLAKGAEYSTELFCCLTVKSIKITFKHRVKASWQV